MNSIWAILFVVFATILAKWLLTDNDASSSDELDDHPDETKSDKQ